MAAACWGQNLVHRRRFIHSSCWWFSGSVYVFMPVLPSWISRDEESATDWVFTTTVGMPVSVGRLRAGNNKITGFATPYPPVHSGRLYVADLNLNKEIGFDEYDVLVVSPSCSLAWVPYKAGDSLPDGAQKTGFLNGVAVYSENCL